MDKKEFKKALSNMFKKSGFVCKSNHFYKDITDETQLVFGLQASNYGSYYYIEYGYCFKSICNNPYPKFYESNLRVGRFCQALEYEDWNEEKVCSFEEDLAKVIETATEIGMREKMDFINCFFQMDRMWFIQGDHTAAYFGMTRNDFRKHFIDPNV